MGWPQIVMIIFMTIGLSFALLKHGQSKPPYDFWAQLIATVIQIGILWAGGFFK